MKRTLHGLSHYRLLTCDMGELVPVMTLDVLPGDTIQGSSSMLLRLSPLVAPVMHPVQVRLHTWFCPYRLLWDDWEDFITGGPDGMGAGTAYPKATGVPVKGGILDYLGIPPGFSVEYGTLPLYAYNLIWNEFYRDQDLEAEAALSNGGLKKVSWAKDGYTTARPWTQKGPEVTLPLGSEVAVLPGANEHTATAHANAMRMRRTDGTIPPGNSRTLGASGVESVSGTALAASGAGLFPTNLFAQLQNSSVSIADFRRGFAIQRYQEARAQYGSRFSEYLAYLGVRAQDSRLQRPEYIGGGKATISFSEVLQTGPDPTDGGGVGNLLGHGISAMRSRRFRKFIPEHGVVLTLLSVRPRNLYMQGLPRMWSKRTKEDYWQRELEFIGQQEVLNSELWTDGTAADNETFGYQDRYYEYRHQPSQVSGDFRDTLNFWHLARDFAARPVLNQSFVSCNPSKRIFAEQTSDALWCMVQHSIQARRLVSKYAPGRIV